MSLLSMSIYVIVILLSGGNCASNGGNIIDDLRRGLEQLRIQADANVITPDDLTRALEQARIHSILADEENELAKALALSFQSTPGELTTPADTKYAYVRSLIKDIFNLLLHEMHVIKPAMDDVVRHRHLFEKAEKLRESGQHLYRANRKMITSCNVLYGIRTLFEKSVRGYADIIEHVEILYRESRVVVNERPLTASGIAIHIPMDIDTDVEMLSRYVVVIWENVGFKQHFDNLKALFQADLLPAIHHCERALRTNERFPDDMRAMITEDVEKETARLFEGHERHTDGRIVEPESIFYTFAANALATNEINFAFNFLISNWNTVTVQNANFRHDMCTLADLIRRQLSLIEVDFAVTNTFLKSALSMSIRAEALGYFMSFHSAAHYGMDNDFLRIDGMKFQLTKQLARIESILQPQTMSSTL